MNKFCRSLVVNLHHLRPPILLGGRPMHVQSTLAILSLDRGTPFRIFPASSSIAAARPYYKDKRDGMRGDFDRARTFQDKPRFNMRYKERETKPLDEDEFGDAVPVESVGHEVSFEASSTSTNGFAEFNLPESLIRRMDQLGYKKPFEIQAATLKNTLDGR